MTSGGPAAVSEPVPVAGQRLSLRFGQDRDWIAVMAILTALELGWWAVAWLQGIAPAPWIAAYLGFAGVGLVAAAIVRAMRHGRPGAPWHAVVAGTLLVAIGASVFLPLKYAIPSEIPFWLDRPLAIAERSLLGADPWLVLDRWLGWATRPLDLLYGCWLPVQLVVLFLVILAAPSRAKSRALIAYSLAWFVLGAVAAALLSSVGPLFFDRVFGGELFGALRGTLQGRGAAVALAESDRMWQALATGRPGLVAGISAMPSIHVAISLWIVLVARTLRPGAAIAAWVYFALVWLGSVQLGWHYASDGLAGALGMAAMWWLAGVIERRATTPA